MKKAAKKAGFRPYQLDWLAKFGPLATANERRFGVPRLFTLAQQLVESSWSLAKLGNNFFGIKADPKWTGPSNVQRTHEYDAAGREIPTAAAFRAYATPADAYVGHATFLRTQPRYRAAFQTKDPVAFAEALARAGYATDPNYFPKLRELIFELSGQSIPASAPVGAGALLLLGGLAYWLSRRK